MKKLARIILAAVVLLATTLVHAAEVTVFAAASLTDSLKEIATTYGVRAAFSDADLLKPTEATRLIEDATRKLGRVDVLVNNAGIQHVARCTNFRSSAAMQSSQSI